ncbi:unnamed protein product [Menidia menidia]|uniref:(Atlantic silverside) hypothetical protein n=1 Tax=Menidia menidia TaxID=238744 RepID=A0A8S4BHZ1_9TELE|nr:unnamed protein product [Menidia menidia]
MRHFTASTAIRQDGPLALSLLTGVLSVFSLYFCFQAIGNLNFGCKQVACSESKTRVYLSGNDDVGEQVR